jgi:hypothetical protein
MGVRIMKMNEGDVVTSVVVRTPEEDELKNGQEPEEGDEGETGVDGETRSADPDTPTATSAPHEKSSSPAIDAPSTDEPATDSPDAAPDTE